MAHTGLVSVIPQPCTIGRFQWLRYASISERGTADPPAITRRNDDMSVSGALCSRSFNTVGTAPVIVGRMSVMMREMGAACRYCCGNTSSAPTIQAAYGVPHALAWNIGTTTNMRSRSLSAMFAVDVTISECMYVLRWLYITPFGLPVVPLV